MAQLTYPGVYIEELSSGVHTITGVATSIAAFIGWAPKGPTDSAVLVESWSDFERQYGGLDARSLLGYSVNQFFANGGQQAYLVRIAWDARFAASPGTSPVAAATAGSSGIGNAVSTINAMYLGVSAQTSLGVSSPTLTAITVSPANPAMPAGTTQQFTATGLYSDGSTADLTSSATWASATPAAATITSAGASAGLATAVAAGVSAITATVGSVTSTPVSLTVTTATLASIAVTPATPSLPVGLTQQFTATGLYSDGSSLDLTKNVTWASATTAKATITPAGVATAVAAGASDITASKGGVTSPAVTLTVTAATLASIAVTPATPTIPVGSTLQFTAMGLYSDGSSADLTSSATWASATTTTATITAAGLATGVASGASTITASKGATTSNSVTLTISAAAPSSISVTPANPTVAVGHTVQFKAIGFYADGAVHDLTSAVAWSSASPAIATIAASGVATGVAANSGALTLYAVNPGQWGDNLRVGVKVSSSDPTRFSLLIQDASGGVLETFANLSTNALDPLGRYVVNVIDNSSQYVTFINPASPGTPVSAPAGSPSSTPVPVALFGGADGSALNPGTDGNFEVALGLSPVAGAPYGVHVLDPVEIFNLLCVPGESIGSTVQNLQQYCAGRRAFYIVDAPQDATFDRLNAAGPLAPGLGGAPPSAITTAPNAGYSAYYFPWVSAPDPLFGNRAKLCPPCGFVAGRYAATDAARGVWKAPAGIDAGLSGVLGLQYVLTDLQNGDLNHQAINCLREFKVYGDVIWGARTLLGDDEVGSEWKYVPIRRLALFIESSLYNGTQWIVFEPNDEPLWRQIRLNVGVFMNGLFRQGAFQGSTPQQAYFVKCDAENNPQSSIDLGVVNILVGFAPLFPAEFVVIQIQQMAGQLQA